MHMHACTHVHSFVVGLCNFQPSAYCELFNRPIVGAKYTFRMSATVANALGGSIQSFSDFDVEVNSPPSGGGCSVSPSSGSGDTIFALECSGWSDKHQPVTFRFGYSDIVQAPTTTPSYSLNLPTGLQIVSASACDAYMSCSAPILMRVNVTAAPINAAAIDDQMKRLAYTGDANHLNQSCTHTHARTHTHTHSHTHAGDTNALLSFASSKMQDVAAAKGRRLLVDSQAVADGIVAQV